MSYVNNNLKWNIILSGALDPALNMGLDEALLNALIDNKIPVTVRIYSWTPPALTIGYAQDLRREVDLAVCEAEGVPVIRRITGGGAVLHEQEATYSIVAPVSLLGDNITESYRYVSRALIVALGRFDVDATFVPVNDVLAGEKKISGSAQLRRGGAILQHGTILIRADVGKMFRLLNVSADKIKRKGITNAEERVTSLERELGHSVEYSQVESALEYGFEHLFGCAPDVFIPDDALMKTARLFSENRFSSDAWNFDRKPPTI